MAIRWTTILLDRPADGFDRSSAFWAEATASSRSAPRGPDGEFATLVPDQGDAYVRVQRVRDGAGGAHLDLHVDGESLDQAAGRATALGATVRSRAEGLILLDSPGGFTFCLVGWNGEERVPPPVELDGAGANRLDQLTLDIPPDDFETEGRFWAEFTGWEPHPGSRPEFAYLDRPTRIPVRILLHRRDRAEPGDRVSAHIDVAATDLPALAARQVGAGAQVVARFPHWITLVDPAGRPYCLTGRDPWTGALPRPS